MKPGSFFLSLFIVLAIATSGAAQHTGDSNSWQFDLGLYFWYADVNAKSTTGGDLIDKLQGAFMGMLEVRRGDWSFLADVIYVKLEDDRDIAAGLRADTEMTNWIVTPIVTYRLMDSDEVEVSVLAGARYLYLDTDLALTSRAPLPPGSRSGSRSKDNWDGIIGVRGSVNLTENWFLPFHLDFGTGDSQFTWQGLAGIGYRFSRVDIVAGYRYLDWQFDNRPIIDSLDYKGPFAGIKFRF